MSELSDADKEAIKKRRGYRCDRDGRKHQSRTLQIHHKDRNRQHNESDNLRVLCKKHHAELHRRAGY
jgi:hypothetical protein